MGTSTVLIARRARVQDSDAVVNRLLALSGAAYRLALRVVGTHDVAEDVVQQAYLETLQVGRVASPLVNERAWFLKVVSNIAKNRLRSDGRRRRREMSVKSEGVSSPTLSSDLISTLAGAVAMLDEKYRLPVALCYEEGLSRREAADVLEIHETTLGDRLKEGVEKLRRALEHAGYPAAVAAVLGGLKQTAPSVPESLAGHVEALVAQGMTKGAAGAASASASAAAKGGTAMKMIAGVVLAGALAAGVALMSGGGRVPSSLPAEAPKGERKDPASDQAYRVKMLVRSSENTLDGPIGQAECIDGGKKGLDLDDAGNWYWINCGNPVLSGYDRGDGRVRTLAGSGACGLGDGPLERARFGGWSYVNNSLLAASGDGRHVFVRDQKAGGAWRHIDLETGMVRTLENFRGGKEKGMFIVVRDKSGGVYAFRTSGAAVPECRGYKPLKVAPFGTSKNKAMKLDSCALDVERMRFYWHARGPIMACDLKTGKVTTIVASTNKKPVPAGKPFAGLKLWCPSGMSISPAGRFVYVGGGDNGTCHRLDLQKQEAHDMGCLPGGRASSFIGGKGDPLKPGRERFGSAWPNKMVIAPDGSGAWPTSHGIYGLTPAKGGN